jgi:hypothetical protein
VSTVATAPAIAATKTTAMAAETALTLGMLIRGNAVTSAEMMMDSSIGPKVSFLIFTRLTHWRSQNLNLFFRSLSFAPKQGGFERGQGKKGQEFSKIALNFLILSMKKRFLESCYTTISTEL